MSDYSKISSESMKQLTERVMNADMAQRKRKLIHAYAMKFRQMLIMPLAFYVIYDCMSFKGKWKSANVQAGDPINLYKMFLGKNMVPFRQIFRPEIYHQTEFENLMQLAKITQTEVAKNENIKFRPYVWH